MSNPFIHPARNRSPQHVAVRVMPPPTLVAIPLRQHIGAPCLPLVEAGGRVLMHQRIGGVPPGALGACVHASVSGVVQSIKPFRLTSGLTCDCVVIENDFLDEKAPCDWSTGEADALTPAQIIEAAVGAGLVGMGGAAFPAAIKLSPKSPVDTLILNGAECEPYLSCDNRLMLEEAELILRGTKAAMRTLGANTCLVAIEKNKPKAIAAMREAANGSNIDVRPLPARYPQGSEKQLIDTLLHRRVPLGKLPADIGVVVFNVGTMAALARALSGVPCTERILTVAGDAIAAPCNLLVRTGTSLADVFETAGGFTTDPGKLIAGGPMMGVAQPDLSAPVMKSTSGLLAFSPKTAALPEPTACIRCGLCTRQCPMGLRPGTLADAWQAHDQEALARLQAKACIECGNCSYICPARRPLVQAIRMAKAVSVAESIPAAKQRP